MFCPKCGSLLRPSKDKKMMVCSCGYKTKELMKIKETVKKAKEIEVVDKELDLKALPKTDAECPKCHHRKAYYWLVQTRASDEPETKFLKCEKCGHVWRDYS